MRDRSWVIKRPDRRGSTAHLVADPFPLIKPQILLPMLTQSAGRDCAGWHPARSTEGLQPRLALLPLLLGKFEHGERKRSINSSTASSRILRSRHRRLDIEDQPRIGD